MTGGRSDDDALEMVLKESATYREMVSVLLEKLYEAYRRERYRRGKHGNVDR